MIWHRIWFIGHYHKIVSGDTEFEPQALVFKSSRSIHVPPKSIGFSLLCFCSCFSSDVESSCLACNKFAMANIKNAGNRSMKLILIYVAYLESRCIFVDGIQDV